MTWKDRLIDEAEKIVTHGEGKINFMAGERSGSKTSIVIEATKIHRYTTEKIEDD